MTQSGPGTIDQPELRLLLACARTSDSVVDGPAIREMLERGIDWSIFARKAVGHGVAGLVGHTIEKVAPDVVPADLLDALRMNKEYIRSRNDVLCDGFRQSAAALANRGLDAIWFRGPILGIHAYHDLTFRLFGAPAFLVREQTAAAAITALRDIDFRQKSNLTAAQLDLIRQLRGHETLSNRSLRIGADVHTRLTPINMPLHIDYDGLWRRSRPEPITGHTVRLFAPEDEVLALSIRAAGDGTWQLGEACDFAGLVASHPNLDWGATFERARAQGCLRMLLLAISLARRYFGTSFNAGNLSATRLDPIIEAMVSRTVALWQADESRQQPDDKGFSRGLLNLQDSSICKASYLMRSLVLPDAPHVSRIALPRRLTNLFAYSIIKVVQDAAILPPLRMYRRLRANARRLRDRLASHELGLAVIPVSSERRRFLRRYNAARVAAERVLTDDPKNLTAWQDLGDALFRLERHEEAIAAYAQALAISPENSILLRKRAAAVTAGSGRVSRLGTEEEIALNPEDADAWARHAAAEAAAGRFAQAVIAADKALAIDPNHLIATRVGLRSRIVSCDWRRSEEDERRVADAFGAGVDILTPAGNRALCDSEAQNLVAARLWTRPFVRPPKSQPRGRNRSHDRIRLAYLCSEYHDHPVGRQIVGVFEHHDRSRFETSAISLGGANSSAIRLRIQAACDNFVSVNDKTDEEIAAIISDMEIDIAIDLDRFAARARPGILAGRPAPLQVTYFGNAGTTGAPFLDYIVADRTVIPADQFQFYTEKVIYLPNSYQCNDSRRRVPPTGPSRREAGLPETGFVYCCFNQNYKIRPPVFDIWMRLLQACPGSVLWLLGGEPYTIHNLRREVAARGVASERIVFAPFVPNDDHIARHRLADLFLDTLPCNAHATASDALWGGLPILTCLGNTFGGRVGASLLRAVGLPEMVTESLSEYEALAIMLTQNPERLAAIKAKLAVNRDREPLFDTAGLTRALETAFEAIWRQQQAGLAPQHVAV